MNYFGFSKELILLIGKDLIILWCIVAVITYIVGWWIGDETD